MPRPDRTDRCRSGRYQRMGWAVLIGLSLGLPAARAQEATDTLLEEPIVLAGDQVSYWDEGPERFVWLEGRCALLQGTDGLRSDTMLARIVRDESRGGVSFRVEVYAEGKARFTSEIGVGAASLRMMRRTVQDVRIKGHGSREPRQLPKPPVGVVLMERGFPDHKPPVPPARTELLAAAPPPMAGNGILADAAPDAAAPRDDQVMLAQFGEEGFSTPFGAPDMEAGGEGLPAPLPPSLPESFVVPGSNPAAPGFPEGLEAQPPSSELPVLPPGPGGVLGPAPILPNTRRVIAIYPKNSGGVLATDVKIEEDGRATVFLRGGVNVVAEAPGQGIIDITADNAVIWTQFGDGQAPPAGEVSSLNLDTSQPIELYLEGNVTFRQDSRQVAGNGDQKVVEAQNFYIDMRTESFLAEAGRLNLFDARFITPIRVLASEVRQYRPIVGQSSDGLVLGPTQIRADRTLLTGSRFPEPGYRFRSSTVELTQRDRELLGPDGKPIAAADDPNGPQDSSWQIDARNNAFFIGPVPVFYWPRVVTDSEDLDPPIRQIQFRSNNYLGQQLLTDWSVFKLFGAQRPPWIDNWNLDLDYLSARGFAVGSELGWSGRDLWDNITDPYNRVKSGRQTDLPFFGYFDIWGLRENRGVDTLGPGPAVITNGPPGAGALGFQRTAAPSYQDYRGRFVTRHMQFFTPSDVEFDRDLRLQLEGAYTSDRHFLEQYYKGLFDMGLDQKTLAYGIYQRENRALSVLASANLQPWLTDSQWFPKVEYNRLADSILGDRLTWFQDYGIDYANVHTDVMVNNPDIFTFQPFDPVSATSGPFSTGRLWTAQELDLPINLQVLKLVPYVQGQAVGWDNQYQESLPDLDLNTVLPDQAFIRGDQGATLGRYWGAAGIRANMTAWRLYPGVESELWNVHGLGHKINFSVNYRNAYSNVGINRIGIQDELDDNTYEYVRRYFALINYRGGVLPPQYDPRLLTLRRTVSPITGTTDVQDTIQTLDLAIHQRLQTKRGPEGRRRIVDYMVLDLSTTYFPQGTRDNFGKAFGQNMYNWEWYVGDRTSLISNGWFEFFDITGDPIPFTNPRDENDPFKFAVVTNGISINRPPRGNVFFGYSVINTGPIFTSALNVAYSYWLSPKWYTSFGTSYDFGNAILLGSTFGITRIGSDFLTSIGLSVDPQRDSYMFGFELTPRLSPNIRLGSGGGIARFDSRYAPTQ